MFWILFYLSHIIPCLVHCAEWMEMLLNYSKQMTYLYTVMRSCWCLRMTTEILLLPNSVYLYKYIYVQVFQFLKTCPLLLLISSSVELVLELLLKLFGMYFVKRLTTSGDFTMDFDLQLGFTKKFYVKHYCKINPKHCFVKFYGWRPKFSDLHF